MLQKQLTYLALRNRIRNIALAHKLIKGVYFNRYVDLVEDKNVSYPALFIQPKDGTISPGKHDASIVFRLFFVDRTFLSTDTTDNEADVISDMIGTANDIIAQINRLNNVNGDAQISDTSNFQILIDKDSDVTAGIYFDITLRIIFYQNVCAAPSNIPIDPDMDKLVYDITWAAPEDILDGQYSFNVPDDVKNKKVLLVIRANFPLLRTGSTNITEDETTGVQSNEFAFDGVKIYYGTTIQPGERALILYRQY